MWVTAFIAVLLVLATGVWQGAPVLHFVGAVTLGVIGPLGTRAIVKRYPETDRLAWVLLGVAAGIIAPLALLRLWA